MDFYMREAFVTAGLQGKPGRILRPRIAFTVEKTEDSFTNKATISLWNLNGESRAVLEEKKTVIRLDAGYKNNPSLLFIGQTNLDTVGMVKTTRQGPDIITTVEAGDGELNLTNAHLEVSLGPGATNRQVFEALVKSIGIALAVGVKKDFPVVQYGKGFSYAGRAKDLMDRLMKDVDYRWSIQNNEIQVTPRLRGTGEEAAYITPQTGLINIPSKTDEGFTFESVLDPRITPGRLVTVESGITGKGVFRVVKSVHVGDTHEGEWKTTFEGVPRGQ